MSGTKRVYPFPLVHPEYYSEASVYPDKVRVSMDDGKVIDYYLKEQPKPTLKAMLDKFTETCVGGEKYKKKGVGKRTGRMREEKNNG